MRILHTSDWHLGRSFGPISLRSDQEAFCDWFVGLTIEESADLVIVAGDVYDRAIAPTESIELFRETLRRLRSTGAVVAVIAGNHDGADRVSPYDDLLDAGGVYVRGGYTGVGRVIVHEFPDGPLDLVLLPFLEPQAAPDRFGATAHVGDGDGDGLVERRRRRTHQSVLGSAIAEARSAIRSPRSIAIAHAFVTGGETSESERQLEVGGTGSVDAELFSGFSYTALGHLHRPQHIGRETLRYSGTPLPYSFSENHPKSVTAVEMDPRGDCSIREVAVPIGRPVATIRGTIDALCHPTAHPEAHERFVRAIVTDRETVLDAKARLEQVYPYTVEIRLEPEGRSEVVDQAGAGIAELDPVEAAHQFWEAIERSPPDDIIAALLTEAIRDAARVSS